METRFDSDQLKAINAREGAYSLLSGPGSGKTTTLIGRYQKLRDSGVRPTEILGITFSKEAATTMAARSTGNFRTFHSFGYEIISKEKGRPPMEPELRLRLLYALMRKYGLDFKELTNYISRKRHANITPEQAIEEDAYGFPQAFATYERTRIEQGWIDFDSMIRDAVNLLEDPSVRKRHQYPFIMADECQDTDDLQFRFLQLLNEKYGNIMCIGDPGQCQPPETKVLTLKTPAKNGRGCNAPAVYNHVPISELCDGDCILSWTKQDQRVYQTPRKVKVAKRMFHGPLVVVESNGNKTKMTPNHWVWARFSEKVFVEQPYYVYLMWRKDRGFRVGISFMRRRGECNQLGHRGRQEKAEKFWILEFASTRPEAEMLEEYYSANFGIPQCVFEAGPCVNVTEENIRWLFERVSDEGGFSCLEHCGLLFDCPLLSWPNKQNLRGYFKIAAANLIAGYMTLPTPAINGSAIIDSVTRETYEGFVYSLDVEKDHTYIADGIPVGNSIYMFRGAQPDNLVNFQKWFPGGQHLYLGRNYRSTQTIVDYVRKHYPLEIELKEKLVAARKEKGVPIEYRQFDLEDDEAEASVAAANADPLNSAILARTNRQLAVVENFCDDHNIPYTLLGKSGFWKQAEIRKVVDKLKPWAHLSVQMAFGNVMPGLESHYQVEDSTPEDNYALDNIRKFREIITRKQFGTCREAVAYATKRMHVKRKAKGITLSTVHQAKGCEWKNVFIIGVRDGVMPHAKGDWSEERRIYMVAISRAIDRLRLSFTGSASIFIRNELTDEILLTMRENSAKVERLQKQQSLF